MAISTGKDGLVARDELAAVTPGLAHEVRGPIGKYRWTICALLLFATTINYLDRQVTSVLAPTLQAEFHWSETQYANITSWWTAAYAIGFLGIGRFIDRVGVRIGFAI